ncbi:MAG: Ldh family oxidoreductase [Clostridia bacterium]
MGYVNLDKEALSEDLLAILVALGVSEADAKLTSEVLIRTEQWGVRSHGVMRIKRYADCLISGGIRKSVPFTIERESGAWALVDAGGGLGIPASVKATELAMRLAKAHTIGMVNVHRSHHNGAEGYYANFCAERSMAGLVMSTGNPIMAVTGSADRTIGNNPFAYAVPGGRYGTVMMDIAMSAVADGKIQVAKADGEQLPPGCFLDASGRPSTEPEDYLSGGVLLPFGGHKGYGLAVMVEALAGILSGAALTREINSWNETPGTCGDTGHMILAIDISRIMDLQAFTARVEEMVRQFKESRKLPGVREILIPGELERRRLADAGGSVSLTESAFEQLQMAADMAGVSLTSTKQNGEKIK